MADDAQLLVIRKGAKAWNKWRKENPDTPVDLLGANLRLADLRGTDLQNANLHGADFREVDFSGADLNRGTLSRVDLRKANLGGTSFIGANLSEADLSDADLSGADLSGADLSGAHLNGTNLSDIDLSVEDLSEANLGLWDRSVLWASSARLRIARAEMANRNKTNFVWPYLSNTPGPLVTKTNLIGATVSNTVFANVDLSQVKGLETVKHRGPSEISISTIYRSQGKIPFEFLRGAGVPDIFIEYMHSLTGAAYEFYSCFISYSSKDQEFAERLHADLQNNGVRCWFAPHDAHGGQKLHQQIDQAIRLHEKLLLILSTDSMKSEWVKTEIRKAAKRQTKEKKDVLFPVSLVPFDELRAWECFDGDLGKDLGAEIREYLIPDFSRWKEHDPYQKAFAKLLRDLRSGKTKTG
jgi:uncharacterized protein YjbI with pentapeptide repeats